MPAWLIVLLLEALGLFLWWNGERGGDELQSSLGGILVVSVTALFLFRLVAGFLTRRHSGKPPPTRARPEPFLRLRQHALLGTLLSPWSGSRGTGKDSGAADI